MAEQTTEVTVMHITVDGKAIETRPGELVIEAAERAGVYIPRFCWHPRLKPVGMCRMCLIEIEGVRGLPPACTTPVTEGMVVHTQSPTVKKAQDGVLEFLLANHPLDCPVCDKGGECPLQDQTVAFGPGESRFVEEKRHYEKPIDLSSLVSIDRERCILCARCTRFADEVAGEPLISFVERGDRSQVLTFPDEPFSSYFSGNTVEICPVGALLAKPYRFRARPWDLDENVSTCSSCSVGCATVVQSSRDEVVRVLGRDNDEVSHGWLCDKGRFDFEATQSSDRLTSPLAIGRSGASAKLSWSDATAELADRIEDARRRGADRVAFVGGAHLTNEAAYAWSKLARGVIGSALVDCSVGDDLNSSLALGLPSAQISDLDSADSVLLVGFDPREIAPVLFLRLKQAVEAGKRLVEINSFETGLTRYASVSLRVMPGEVDLVIEQFCNSDPVATGGVEPTEIRQARLEMDGSIVVVVGRGNLAESPDLLDASCRALSNEFPNAKFLISHRRANSRGAVLAGLGGSNLPVGLEFGADASARGWKHQPSRSFTASEIFQRAAEGEVDVLVLLGADPLMDFPDRRLAEAAFARVGYIASVDLFETESVKRSDLALPALASGEVDGLITNLEGRVSQVNAKVSGPGVARSDWQIAQTVARALGAKLDVGSLAEIRQEMADLGTALGDATAGTQEGDHGVVAHELVPFEVREAAHHRRGNFSYRLVLRRRLFSSGAVVERASSLRGLVPASEIFVNPADGEKLGVHTGDTVKVSSAAGSVGLKVRLDARVRKGIVEAIQGGSEDVRSLISADVPYVEVRVEAL